MYRFSGDLFMILMIFVGLVFIMNAMMNLKRGSTRSSFHRNVEYEGTRHVAMNTIKIIVGTIFTLYGLVATLS